MRSIIAKRIALCFLSFSFMCAFAFESMAESYMVRTSIETQSEIALDRLYLYSYYPETGKIKRSTFDPSVATDTDINSPMDRENNANATSLEEDYMPYGIIGSDGRKNNTRII